MSDPAGNAGVSSKLRILQLITDRDRRGAQVYALDLGDGLRRLGASVETVALAPGTHGDMLPVEVLGHQRLALTTLRSLRRLARNFDVVVAHGSSTLPACALALLGTRTPVVYRQISDPLFWAATPWRRLRVAMFLRRVSGVVALSDGTAAIIGQRYWLKPQMVNVIPNAVPATRFRPPTSLEQIEARTSLRISATSKVVLFIGALVREKGADLAIAAVSASTDAILILAGDGQQRLELESLAHDELPGRARFLGSVDDPRRLYWAADLLLFPTRGGDSMPAVLIEAGLCGLPSVTTPVGAIAEIVEHDVTGLVVPAGESAQISTAVARLLNDPAKRASMGRAATTRCLSRFTISQTATTWFSLLDALRDPASQR